MALLKGSREYKEPRTAERGKRKKIRSNVRTTRLSVMGGRERLECGGGKRKEEDEIVQARGKECRKQNFL